jgi:hypothetical protein
MFAADAEKSLCWRKLLLKVVVVVVEERKAREKVLEESASGVGKWRGSMVSSGSNGERSITGLQPILHSLAHGNAVIHPGAGSSAKHGDDRSCDDGE